MLALQGRNLNDTCFLLPLCVYSYSQLLCSVITAFYRYSYCCLQLLCRFFCLPVLVLSMSSMYPLLLHGPTVSFALSLRVAYSSAGPYMPIPRKVFRLACQPAHTFFQKVIRKASAAISHGEAAHVAQPSSHGEAMHQLQVYQHLQLHYFGYSQPPWRSHADCLAT
jgi:hypothetical protein